MLYWNVWQSISWTYVYHTQHHHSKSCNWFLRVTFLHLLLDFLNPPNPARTFTLRTAEIAVLDRSAWELYWDFTVILGIAKVLPSHFYSLNNPKQVQFQYQLIFLLCVALTKREYSCVASNWNSSSNGNFNIVVSFHFVSLLNQSKLLFDCIRLLFSFFLIFCWFWLNRFGSWMWHMLMIEQLINWHVILRVVFSLQKQAKTNISFLLLVHKEHHVFFFVFVCDYFLLWSKNREMRTNFLQCWI